MGWFALVVLGAYHGVNPAMGWLFAVALGMQDNSARAVVRSLAPMALGHAAAIVLVLLLAGLVEIVLPLAAVKLTVAGILLGLGLYRLLRSRHPRWVGMQVGFRDLTVWPFLMASAHGAGLMVWPVIAGMSTGTHAAHADMVGKQLSLAGLPAPFTGLAATLIHTAGYLAATAAIALVVYEKAGLALLRKAWVNLDLVWAVALMVTGWATLLV